LTALLTWSWANLSKDVGMGSCKHYAMQQHVSVLQDDTVAETLDGGKHGRSGYACLVAYRKKGARW